MLALQHWTDGQPPADLHARPTIAAAIHDAVYPILQAAAWPRWLFLERALLDGSQTGDLLFSALVIRTMCEEVQRLRSLDVHASEIQRLAVSGDATDQSRFMLFLRMVRANLDEQDDPRDFDPSRWSDLDCTAISPPQLQSARQALNDYVHPNYGSHIAALYPERGETGRLLIEGIIAAYDAFFSLSWAEQPLPGSGAPLDVAPIEGWHKTVSRFTKQALPQVTQAKAWPSEVLQCFEGRAVVASLKSKQADAEGLLDAPEIAALVDSLRFSDDLLPKDKPQRGSGRYRLWEGASAQDILLLARARKTEQDLSNTFPKGMPSKTEQERWLRFLYLALALAVNVDEVKSPAMRTQLVRQTVRGNPLGILLCLRSLIENQAVAEWLAKRLETQWAEIGKRVKPAKDLPSHSAKLEEALAKFLAGTKGSGEVLLPWTNHEINGRWTLHLSLPDVIDGAFEPDDCFRVIYNIASAALHGRFYRGLDLLKKKGEGASLAGLSILVLERLCDLNAKMDVSAPAIILGMKFEHAASLGGAATLGSDTKVKAAFSHFEGKLKPGRDYTGDGSKGNPFCFQAHHNFHVASYKLLQQLGIENAERELIKEGECFYDVYRLADNEWWFLIPSPPKE
jgi:hypothetical protein